MNILIAPDSFKGTLSAVQACAAIERGVLQEIPHARCVKFPIADGGEGTVDVLVRAGGGEMFKQMVCGPLEAPTEGVFGLLKQSRTALVECASASGLDLVKPTERDVMAATSFGTGELIEAALALDIDELIIGLGGSATVDGGAGLLQALGVRFFSAQDTLVRTRMNATNLADLERVSASDVASIDTQVRVRLACDVDTPLLGPFGAAPIFGPQKGASVENVETLSRNLTHFSALVERDLGRSVGSLAGGGAAGGMAAALVALFDAEVSSGSELVLDALNFNDALARAVWVVTGEGCIDGQTSAGKAPLAVARRALAQSVPVTAIGGRLESGSAALLRAGISALESCITAENRDSDYKKDAFSNLVAASARAARRFRHGEVRINPFSS